jgi:hypothetical protein
MISVELSTRLTNSARKTVVLPVDIEEPKSLESANIAQIGVPGPREPSVLLSNVRGAEAVIDEATEG